MNLLTYIQVIVQQISETSVANTSGKKITIATTFFLKSLVQLNELQVIRVSLSAGSLKILDVEVVVAVVTVVVCSCRASQGCRSQ